MLEFRESEGKTVLQEEESNLMLIQTDESQSPDEDQSLSPSTPLSRTAQGGTLMIKLDSLGVSILDHFSLVRIFRKEFSARISFYQSEDGGGASLERAIELATHEMDEKKGAKLLEKLLTKSADDIQFIELYEIWKHSSKDGEYIWREMKYEAQQEFMSGHLAATVFEPVDWMRSAWKRAEFLGVRDSFIDEYEPEGGVEVALVDIISQSYFLYLYWTEESVRRTRTDPRRVNDEFRNWAWYKQETGDSSDLLNPGYWEIPYASELECQEQALNNTERFLRLFLKVVRMFNDHRIAKARLKKLSVRSGKQSIVDRETEHARAYSQKLRVARKAQRR